MLMRELNEITSVQEEAKIKFEKDVSNLEQRLNGLVGSSEMDLADGNSHCHDLNNMVMNR